MWRCEKASSTAPTYEQQYAMKRQSKQTLCKSGPPSNSVKKHSNSSHFLVHCSSVDEFSYSPSLFVFSCVSHRHSPLKPFIHYKKSSQHCCVVLSISLGSHEPEILKGVFDIMIIFYLFTFTLVWISWWVCKLVAFTCGLGFFFLQRKNSEQSPSQPKCAKTHHTTTFCPLIGQMCLRWDQKR